MEIRSYTPTDCCAIAHLFYETVHNIKDYTEEQRYAWASGRLDTKEWNRSFLAHSTLVAIQHGMLVGFGDMDNTGYLDRLYVHKSFQRQGIATMLCDRLEQRFHGGRVITHASIAAKPFFENRGYFLIREQQVIRNGISLTNFIMQKDLKNANI